MLLHVELDGVVHLRRRVGELPGIRHDQADLHGLLRAGRRHGQPAAAAENQRLPHQSLPKHSFLLAKS
jgi:hypothetical protein